MESGKFLALGSLRHLPVTEHPQGEKKETSLGTCAIGSPSPSRTWLSETFLMVNIGHSPFRPGQHKNNYYFQLWEKETIYHLIQDTI